MSHTSKLKTTSFNSEASIYSTAAELQRAGIKCKLERNVAPRMYFKDQFQKATGRDTADLVLVLEDSEYDLGFIKNVHGAYEPIFDSYKRQVCSQLGATHGSHTMGGIKGTEADIGRFTQLYNKNVALETAAEQGCLVESCELNPNTGKFEIVIA